MIYYINIYRYDTGRLHSGTGVYDNTQEALEKARHKERYVETVAIVTDQPLEIKKER